MVVLAPGKWWQPRPRGKTWEEQDQVVQMAVHPQAKTSMLEGMPCVQDLPLTGKKELHLFSTKISHHQHQQQSHHHHHLHQLHLLKNIMKMAAVPVPVMTDRGCGASFQP